MPKPKLLRRPSGLYARYWVPLALREVVGSKTIVRSLGSLRGDAARLEAARLGYALAHRFAEMKRDASPQEILARAKRARADPIAPETLRRSVAAVRTDNRRHCRKRAMDLCAV